MEDLSLVSGPDFLKGFPGLCTHPVGVYNSGYDLVGSFNLNPDPEIVYHKPLGIDELGTETAAAWAAMGRSMMTVYASGTAPNS